MMRKVITLLLVGVFSIFSFSLFANMSNLKAMNKMYLEIFEMEGATKAGLDVMKKELANSVLKDSDAKKMAETRRVLHDNIADIVGKPNFDEAAFVKANRTFHETFYNDFKMHEEAMVKALKQLSAEDRARAGVAMKKMYAQAEMHAMKKAEDGHKGHNKSK